MKMILSVFILVALTGCASKKEKEVRKAVAQEKTVSDGKTLGNTIQELISSSSTLTDAQKQELTNIIAVNKSTAESLSEESFKFRAVLIKELLSGNVDKKKVSVLKKGIKNIEAKKLKNTFDTVEKISSMVSKQPDHDAFADGLIMMDRYSR